MTAAAADDKTYTATERPGTDLISKQLVFFGGFQTLQGNTPVTVSEADAGFKSSIMRPSRQRLQSLLTMQTVNMPKRRYDQRRYYRKSRSNNGCSAAVFRANTGGRVKHFGASLQLEGAARKYRCILWIEDAAGNTRTIGNSPILFTTMCSNNQNSVQLLMVL